PGYLDKNYDAFIMRTPLPHHCFGSSSNRSAGCEFEIQRLECVPRCVVNTVTIRSLRILVAVRIVAERFKSRWSRTLKTKPPKHALIFGLRDCESSSTWPPIVARQRKAFLPWFALQTPRH